MVASQKQEVLDIMHQHMQGFTLSVCYVI